MAESRSMQEQDDGSKTRHWALSLALLFLLVVGCQNGPAAAPVDVPVAEQTLTHVLDGWKAGASAESFQQDDPAIVVQDRDWQTGYVLLEYKTSAPGKPLDANLECDVKLTLRDPAGKNVTKNVTYIVGTDPVLTVFRKIF